MTVADVAALASDQRLGHSAVKVVRGEKLTELQALLIPSHRYMFMTRSMG